MENSSNDKGFKGDASMTRPALSEAPLRSGPSDQASPIAIAPAHRPPFLSDTKLNEIEAHNRIAYRINTGSDLRAMDHGGGVNWGLTCCRDLYEVRLTEILRIVDEVHTMLENATANYADGTTKGPNEADKLGRLAHKAATKLGSLLNP